MKVATAKNEEEWIDKCKTLSNRQLEQAVSNELPPQKSRKLVLVLDEERIETWERTREAMEKLAGKKLTDIEAFDLMCAESLCTHDLTPPLGDPEAPMGGFVAKVIERDGFRCQRPGCSKAASAEVTSGEAQYEDVRDESTLQVRETAPGYGEQSFDSRESRLAIEWNSMDRHPAPP